MITAKSVKKVILQNGGAVSKAVKIAANSGNEEEEKENVKAKEKETISKIWWVWSQAIPILIKERPKSCKDPSV